MPTTLTHSSLDSVPASAADGWFPLAPNQREIWFLQQVRPEEPSYNIGGYLDCPFIPDLPRLLRAIGLVVRRHDALRLELREQPDGLPGQRFLNELPFEPAVVDLREEADPLTAATRWMQASMDNTFELHRPPYFDGAVLRVARDRFLLFFKCHHLVSDGWSYSLLTQDVCNVYSALGRRTPVPAVTNSYRAFVEEQTAAPNSRAYARDLSYWKSLFPSLPAPAIPSLAERSSASRTCAKTALRLSRRFYGRLDQVSGDSGINAFHVVLAALYAALEGYRSEPGMTVGIPILNRSGTVRRQTAGAFVQMLPVKFLVNPQATHRDALKQIAASLREGYRHRRCPLGEINRAVGLAASGREQLFDVTLSFERHDYECAMDGTPVRAVPMTNSVLPVDLSLFVREFRSHDDVEVELVYRKERLSAEAAQWLMQRLRSHLAAFVRDPEGCFGELPLLSADERSRLRAWNSTENELVGERTAVDLFEEIVRTSPNDAALVDENNREWSYAQLNQQANRLANYLRKTGLDRGSVVAVCLERSAELVVCMLGIIKAGMIYLPLSHEEAVARLAGILEEADVQLVLTSQLFRDKRGLILVSHNLSLAPGFSPVEAAGSEVSRFNGFPERVEAAEAAVFSEGRPSTGLKPGANEKGKGKCETSKPESREVICFEDLDAELRTCSHANPPRAAGPQDIAYCIYTSGSTGKPKGALIPHAGLANLVLALQPINQVDRHTRFLQFSAPTFDASIVEVFGTLCLGGCLHIPESELQLIPDGSLLKLLRSRRITHAILPPAGLAILPKADLPDLKLLISAGDTCTPEIVARWSVGRRFLNGYGPTEASVCTTTHPCCVGDPRPPIGRPIANVRVHIINGHDQEAPIGAPGEIAIAGVCLAQGYLNRPDLTRSAFVELPELGRVYRTGDLGRWRPDGVLEHLGRMDRRAKIRGSRVDPGEIEAAIRSHPKVANAVVVTKGEPPLQWLAAYVVPHLAIDELRHYLQQRLTRYMMPSRIVCLRSLPLTPHGKVDLAALPEPVHASSDPERGAPRDSIDEQLQRIWANVLGVECPGIDDDFFMLGGDSLKAAVLGNEVERALHVALPMSILFEQPTIRNVADRLRAVADGEAVRWPVLLPIRPRGPRAPFFCVPGGNASGFYLHSLANELDAETPFYAFQLPGLEPGAVPLQTVEELATLYVERIREVQPRGPYRLGGHSFGGVIAFEMAWRLEQAGQQVDQVVVFDTTIAQDGDLQADEEFPEATFIAEMLRLCGWDEARALSLPANQRGRLADGPELLAFVREFLVARSLLPYNCSDDQLRRVIAVWRSVARAHDRYRPRGSVQAPITLFLARELPTDAVRKEQRASGWGWNQWTRTELRVEWVSGNHVEMLNPPYVKEVGQRLRSIWASRSEKA